MVWNSSQGNDPGFDPLTQKDYQNRTPQSSVGTKVGQSLGIESGYTAEGMRTNPNSSYYGNDIQTGVDNAALLGGRAQAFGGDYTMAQTNQNAARQQQNQAYGLMLGMANGTGPSLAREQMYAGLAQAQSQAAARSAAVRGGGANLAAAQLAGQQQAAGMGGQAMDMARQTAMAEQMGAIQGLGGLAGNIRGADLQQMQGAQAGLQSFSALQQQQYANEMQARMQQQQIEAQSAMQAAQINAKTASDNASSNGQMLGGVLSAAGGVLAMSDERTKTDKRDASSDIDSALAKIRPMAYRYKDEKKGTERIGPMAQDLPEEVIGEVNGLRVVRMDKAAGLALAGLARVSQRLDEMQSKSRGRKMR